jgi:hypothetical protein
MIRNILIIILICLVSSYSVATAHNEHQVQVIMAVLLLIEAYNNKN